MDLLATRYADPSFLLDGYISGGRFCEFIGEFADIHGESRAWEFFLHKVFDMTWEEYSKRVLSPPAPEMSEKQLITTVSNSKSMINNFNPLK